MTEPLPPSLWAETAPPPAPTPPLPESRSAAVAVVGGGYTGLSAALHLAAAGVETVLLEAAEPGWGASGRNGGQVVPIFRALPSAIEARFGREAGRRLGSLAAESADLVFDLVARHRIDCEPVRRGWLQATHAPGRIDTIRRQVEEWGERGAPVRELDRAAAQELTGSARYVAGWTHAGGGHVQPLGYARGLARAALTAGAAVHGGSGVKALARDGTGWRLETARGAVRAQTVLLCTNGYTDDLWPGLRQSLIPVQSIQFATEPLGDNLRRSILPRNHCASDLRRILFYYRLDAAGQLLFGGRGARGDESPARLFDRLYDSLLRLYPHIGRPRVTHRWGGRTAVTLDSLPRLNALAPGLYTGYGYNGRGVAMATMMGKLLAERALGRAAEAVPFPETALSPIPLHALRVPVTAAVIAWKRLQDALD
ncbi:MAG: FAD-binding oxidoreductase [Alphaproteobacteria bacterium]|nr:FAD-binding oxidoreductase [Alphaproteobacteria bacterium]